MPPSIEQLDRNFAPTRVADGLQWYDGRDLALEGKGFADAGRYYARLPARAQGKVRDDVWHIGQTSTGMCLRFSTDATRIAARWSLWSENLAMDHMPSTGVSGLDLYVRNDTLPSGRRWRWLGVGRPQKQENTTNLVDGLDTLDTPARRHFMLYLPLYNGIEQLELGIPEDATLEAAPADQGERALPIVCYGTSIVQGGCASRPGMAYPAIMGRRLERHMINLGFSGNAKAEPELAELISEIDAAVYVLDFGPNVSPEDAAQRTEPFLNILRSARPTTPIVLVENIRYQSGAFVAQRRERCDGTNIAFRKALERLRSRGVPHLLHVPCDDLLGDDGEGTVDGTHPTDVGFQRLAAAIGPVVQAAL